MLHAVLDINVFVAVGVNSGSASARLLRQVKSERLELVWNEETRREAQAVLRRILDVAYATGTAVTPLGPQHARPGAPETYPFGL